MRRYLLIVLLVCAPFAQAALQFVPLSHNSPQDVIFKIEPLLQPGETVIAGHGELIIHASEETLASLLPVIQSLHQPARQLMILVSRDARVVSRDKGYETNGVARIGVGAGNKSSLNAQVNVFDDYVQQNEKGVQKIRVLEGSPAFIATGVQ
ncbi:MAG: hypothetical protein A6F71_01420 [Cycloclasticus sp. symbiont of Poecilosclerida sp. M]|nr:MAG: hypothetical protein A6F71_01420 [Cycloclasticus sp. symbiont of Poecilosclerida sp. M]